MRGHCLGSLIEVNGREGASEEDKERIVQVVEHAAVSFRSPDRTFLGQGSKGYRQVIRLDVLEMGKFFQLCRLERKASEQGSLFRGKEGLNGRQEVFGRRQMPPALVQPVYKPGVNLVHGHEKCLLSVITLLFDLCLKS